MTSSRGTQQTRIAILALIAFLAEAAYVHSLPLEDLVCSIPDDSFFYLRVAQEFWGARDFSFDGVNRTYGFQPLWQLIVIGISSFSVDSVFLFRAVLTLCCLLHVVAGSVLWRLLHSLGGRAAAVSAVLVWTLNPSILVWCWGLKENALYAVTWLLILSQVLAWSQSACSPRLRNADGSGGPHEIQRGPGGGVGAGSLGVAGW